MLFVRNEAVFDADEPLPQNSPDQLCHILGGTDNSLSVRRQPSETGSLFI